LAERAVILAAGSAVRMQKNIEHYVKNQDELTAIRKGEKMAARFGKFPFLDYQILNLVACGIREINIVLKPDDEFFTTHYESNGKILFPEADISYSFQDTPDGTARAVYAAEKFINNEKFLLINGDNHYSGETIRMILKTPHEYSAVAAYDTRGFNEWTEKRLNTFAVIRTYNGTLAEIVEKAANPQKFLTNDLLYSMDNRRVKITGRILTSMNLWFFTPDILEACREVKRHEPRKKGKPGEYELPDAVELMMQKGREIRVYYACEDVLDLTAAEDIPVLEKIIQNNLAAKIAELEKRYTYLSNSPL